MSESTNRDPQDEPRGGGGGGYRGRSEGGDRGPREGGRDGGRDGGRGEGRDAGGPGGRRPRRFHRGKLCAFTIVDTNYIDYKDIEKLRAYIADNGKILPRRVTGASSRHQRMIALAIKRARHMSLLPSKKS